MLNFLELIGEKESRQIKASVHRLLRCCLKIEETKGSCLSWDVEKMKIVKVKMELKCLCGPGAPIRGFVKDESC